MEIRCKSCEFVGEAAEVRALPGGVGLVCAQCSHVNPLNLSGERVERSGAKGEDGVVAGKSNQNMKMHEVVSQDELERVKYLIPAVGRGPRCPKCLALIEQLAGVEREHCARCGLKVTDMERFEPGRAPWEGAPVGKEAEFAIAEQLWERVKEDVERLGAWYAHVEEHDLLDYAVRTLQLRLIEKPDDLLALEVLAKVEKKLQQRVFLATTEAEQSAKAYNGVVARMRERLLMFSLVFWAGILILFGIVFWGQC